MRCWVVTLTTALLLARVVHADPAPYSEPHLDVGLASVHAGFGGGDSSGSMGLHVEEQNGIAARVITLGTIGLPVMAILAFRPQFNTKIVGYTMGVTCTNVIVHECTVGGSTDHPCNDRNEMRCGSDRIAIIERTALTPEQQAERDH